MSQGPDPGPALNPLERAPKSPVKKELRQIRDIALCGVFLKTATQVGGDCVCFESDPPIGLCAKLDSCCSIHVFIQLQRCVSEANRELKVSRMGNKRSGLCVVGV